MLQGHPQVLDGVIHGLGELVAERQVGAQGVAGGRGELSFLHWRLCGLAPAPRTLQAQRGQVSSEVGDVLPSEGAGAGGGVEDDAVHREEPDAKWLADGPLDLALEMFQEQGAGDRGRLRGRRHLRPHEGCVGVLGDDLHGPDTGADLCVGLRLGLAVAADQAAGGQAQELGHGVGGEQGCQVIVRVGGEAEAVQGPLKGAFEGAEGFLRRPSAPWGARTARPRRG